MYLQDQLLMAVPVALYVGFRIRTLIGPKSLKNLSTVLFALVAAGYPVAEALSHGAGGGWTVLVTVLGYSCLPLLLYLIMTVVLADLVVAFLRLTRLISPDTVRSRSFRNGRLAVALAVPLLTVVYGAVNHRVLRVERYAIDVPRRSSAAEGLTIVFMSDLHFRGTTSDGFLDELVAKVNAETPDIVLIGGDMLEGDRRDEDTGRFEWAIRRMVSHYGTYGCPGNHERFNRDSSVGGFPDRAGIRILQDESVTIDSAFVLAGRRDARSRGRMPVADLIGTTPRDLPVVLLAHRPTGFDEARRAGVDLMLSGHTHGGQVFPVDIVTRRQYDLNRGHLERDSTHLFVTSGVQGWGPPIRTVGASEILVIRVAFR
jgi:predicted MPP superfamily phosphohydrolase